MIPPCSSVTRPRTRMPLVVGLSVFLLLASTGVATARWVVAATTTIPVTTGELATQVTGTAGLGGLDITPDQPTTPVALTLHNSSPVPVDYTWEFASSSGTVDPAMIALSVWESTGTTCSPGIPPTGITTGTLATPPPVPVSHVAGETDTVVCAVTSFTGSLVDMAGQSLTATPTLTAHLTTGTWTTTATGDSFTHTISADLATDLAPVTTLTFTDQDDLPDLAGGDIELAWDEVAGATSYRILASTGATLEVTTTSVNLNVDDVGAATWVDIQALGAKRESIAVRHDIRVRTIDNDETLHCN